jgi:hypothetical protein
MLFYRATECKIHAKSDMDFALKIYRRVIIGRGGRIIPLPLSYR